MLRAAVIEEVVSTTSGEASTLVSRDLGVYEVGLLCSGVGEGGGVEVALGGVSLSGDVVQHSVLSVGFGHRSGCQVSGLSGFEGKNPYKS